MLSRSATKIKTNSNGHRIHAAKNETLLLFFDLYSSPSS